MDLCKNRKSEEASSQQRKAQDQITSLENSSKCFLPEEEGKKRTSKGSTTLIPKPERHHRKRELQAKISDEHIVAKNLNKILAN